MTLLETLKWSKSTAEEHRILIFIFQPKELLWKANRFILLLANKSTTLFYFVTIPLYYLLMKRLWHHNKVNCCLGSNCRLQLCTFESNFSLYKTLSCNVNGTGTALTTRKLMLGLAEPQSVYCTSSLRWRRLFPLHVWPAAHWYSQHRHSINTRDHSQAWIVFNDRGGFTAATLYS